MKSNEEIIREATKMVKPKSLPSFRVVLKEALRLKDKEVKKIIDELIDDEQNGITRVTPLIALYDLRASLFGDASVPSNHIGNSEAVKEAIAPSDTAIGTRDGSADSPDIREAQIKAIWETLGDYEDRLRRLEGYLPSGKEGKA